jgi:hypothetical protein
MIQRLNSFNSNFSPTRSMSSGTDDTIGSFSDYIMYLMEHWNRKLDPTEVTPKDCDGFPSRRI